MNAVDNGWLRQATRLQSPNRDQRPSGAIPSLLVIHNISLPPGQFGNGAIARFFTNCLDHRAHPYYQAIEGVQVSAHLLIDRVGAITQFVSFNERAWHAGVSCFQGQEKCNDFSIGIELEGTDALPYTDLQYETLVQVTRDLMTEYPLITIDRIVGHSDIAPERKTDPGPSFEWARYKTLIA